MCGRLSQYHLERMQRLTDLAGQLQIKPRYNIAPSAAIAAIRQSEDGVNGWAMLRWGLIPAWAKNKKFAYRTINAMAETVAQKPAYRAPFRRRRCIVPAEGFYEWRAANGKKQPYYIHMPDRDAPLLMAGRWDEWKSDAEFIESCTIVTTAANDAMRVLHDRMPALLQWPDIAEWLSVENHDVAGLQELLRPYTGELVLTRVSPRVNNARFDDPSCIEAA